MIRPEARPEKKEDHSHHEQTALLSEAISSSGGASIDAANDGTVTGTLFNENTMMLILAAAVAVPVALLAICRCAGAR